MVSETHASETQENTLKMGTLLVLPTTLSIFSGSIRVCFAYQKLVLLLQRQEL